MLKKIILLVLILGAIVFVTENKFNLLNSEKTISQEEAKTKVEGFIRENLVQPGTEFSIGEVAEENGLYKIKVKLGENELVSYLSKDGTKFFPQAMDIAEVEKQSQENKQAEGEPNKEIAKTDKPNVELFVMSYCPFGTQIEKGILPVVDTLGDKIEFSVKFVNYAMHGKKEVDENLRQYCIQKESVEKLSDYLNCFLQTGEGSEAKCMELAKVDKSQTESCVKAADAQFKVTEKFNDKNTWSGGQYPPFDTDKEATDKYGVKGSPTLVVNGAQASSGRDSASLLKAICSGFSNAPEECGKEFSAESPSAGFGTGNASAGSDSASCH